MRFADRWDAGCRLAERFAEMELVEPVVLALPRGGIPVGAEIARAVGAPLDVFVACKVGAPGQAELGIGAVAEGSDDLSVTDVGGRLGLSPERISALADLARRELERRVEAYRGSRALPDLRDRDVILVDDGLATGVTAAAAGRALRRRRPRRVILAVPVCAPTAVRRLAVVVDDVVCVEQPEDLRAVGQWYDDFTQVSDAEVLEALDRFGGRPGDA